MTASGATTKANPVEGSAVYPIGSRVNDRGRLEVGGCDVVELAREFGTPAYVYVTDDIRARARAYLDAFRARTEEFEVVYASKAAPITAIERILEAEGLSIDVASGGELSTALRAGFDRSRIHMHGNNKSTTDLRRVVELGVGHVICDSVAEIERLDQLCAAAGRTQEILIRVTPGVEAETHSYVRTGQLDSKFGLGLADGLDADEPPSIDAYVDVEVRSVERLFDPAPRLLVEPGRSLVGNAGITLYEVGTVKEIPGVRTYVAVDGGISDNLRPMLYGSRYEAIIADRAAAPPDTVVTIAGMHCESSDMLVRDATIASPQVGDVLVTPATGAYGHAMANNYNAVPRPPVILCSRGDARVAVRRETVEDLARRDVD